MPKPNIATDPSEPQLERVSKLIARTGLASRRAAEDLITAGRVAVNGHFISEQGSKADPDKDKITVDGTTLRFEDKPPLVVVLHKPKYTITTRNDPENRTTVFSLLPHQYANLHPVGRLDFETSGVLLLCDDGTLTHLLTHPSHGVEKTYEARVRGEMSKETIEWLERGVKLEDGMTAPCRVRVLAQREKNALVEITLREGRNRQARRMLEAVGHAASSLRRVNFAGVELEGMLSGEHRELFPVEVKKLRRIAEMGLKAKSRPRSRPKPHPRPSAQDEEETKVRPASQPHARMSRSNNGRARSTRENSEGAGRESSGRENAGREGAGREGGGREGASREGGGREIRGREGAGREGGSREIRGRENVGREGAERTRPARESGGRDGVRREGAERARNARESSGRESAGREGVGREIRSRENVGREGVGREGARRENGGREGVRRENAGREGAGRENTGRESRGRESEKAPVARRVERKWK